MVGFLDPVIRHVHITVFQNKGALRPEKILNSQPSLGIELG